MRRRSTRLRIAGVLAVAGYALAGCAPELGDELPSCEGDNCDSSLRSYCDVTIRGYASRKVETDYLPNVLACENETGGLESLKAQAIAARSYLYYKLSRGEMLGNSEGDQVFSCGREPNAVHRQAVTETSGLVFRYAGEYVSGFYVAGSVQNSSDCEGGTVDPTNTQKFVTYNQGLSGNGVNQTSLGFRHPDNFGNRGCMSQNGANCLAERGDTAVDIIQYFYGSDIGVEAATGSCIIPGASIGPGDPIGSLVGDDCAANGEICDIEYGDWRGECISWFDDDFAGLNGFCSIGCEGLCRVGSQLGETYCASLNIGFVDPVAQCVVVPSIENSFCADIAGTEIQVVQSVPLAGDEPEYQGVCVPPDNVTTCEFEGVAGECIDINVTICPSESHAGACPGRANIRCCTAL
ncbi:MAG: hypothetical protein JKY56_01620 [Kofleriaceae bacterium]|nr:hypothetical protein [Kofleriaceae bacterium]